MTFSGQVAEIPLGQEGLTGTKNMSQVRPSQLIVAQDITYENGNLSKEGGAIKYNASALSGTPEIIGGYDWWPDTGTQRCVVVTSAGAILKDSGGGTFGTSLKTALTVSTAIPYFVEGGKEAAANDRKLFIFTGQNPIQVLAGDGVTTSDLSTPPADWTGGKPVAGAIHEGRLWGWGNLNDPHRVYYSTATDHEDFTGAGSGNIPVYPGEGEKLVAGLSFQGLLLLWKWPRGIYAIDTTSPTVSNWKTRRVTGKIGTVSPLSVVETDRDIVFADAGFNLHAMSAVNEFGDVKSSMISQANQSWMRPFIKDNFNPAQYPEIRGVYYDTKSELHFAVARTGSSVNDARLVLDLSVIGLAKFRVSFRDVAQSIWLRKDSDNIPRPVIGDDAGFVWLLDQESRNKDGSGYEGKFQIPHLDASTVNPRLGTMRKEGKFLEISVEPQGNWNLSADIYWDGMVKETVQFNMGTTGAVLGSFVLDTDVLGGGSVSNKRKRIRGGGRRFSVAFRNSGADENFSVSRAFIGFMPAGEKEDA